MLDLIDQWDLIVRIGMATVHVPLARTETAPRLGDRLRLTTERAYDVE